MSPNGNDVKQAFRLKNWIFAKSRRQLAGEAVGYGRCLVPLLRLDNAAKVKLVIKRTGTLRIYWHVDVVHGAIMHKPNSMYTLRWLVDCTGKKM